MAEPAGRPSPSPVASVDPPAARSTTLSRRERWLISLGVFVLGLLSRLLPATWRMRAIAGEEHIDQLLRSRRPVILACWHNRLAICGQYVVNRVIQEGVPVIVLTSLSRDGELMARMAHKAGFGVVRGSPTRGGLQGLRHLYRVISRERCWVGTAPDGSHGPVYECKPGIVILAQIAGVPILPMGAAADRSWRLRSWDRLIIPRPFSRVALAFGEPLSVPKELASKELEAQTRLLAETLNDLGERAQAGL